MQSFRGDVGNQLFVFPLQLNLQQVKVTICKKEVGKGLFLNTTEPQLHIPVISEKVNKLLGKLNKKAK